MYLTLVRAGLWLEEASQEKGMQGKFDDLNGAVVGMTAADQPCRFQDLNCSRRHAVPTGVIATPQLKTTNGRRFCAGNGSHVAILAGERTGKGFHNQRARGIDLGVGGVANSGNVPGVLDEYVLEAPSGGIERYVVLTGILNRAESAVKAAVRATRRNQEAIYRREPLARITNAIGGHPGCRDAVW